MLRAAQHLRRRAHRASSAESGTIRSSASGCSLEITRMRAPALQDLRRFLRMHQAFDGAVHHEAGLLQR